MWVGLMLTSAIGVNSPVAAQNITYDGTLGPAGPVPTQAGSAPYTTQYQIRQEDGQTVGNNLFHSFGRFNLTANEAAVFFSNPSIRNILARVTGGSPSNIDGLIFTQRQAVNLYLLNPSGIVFGPNAQLNIGTASRGSFVASTLESLVWADGSQFSATNPAGPSSLLTIVGDPSGFLATQRTPGAIAVSSRAMGVYPGQGLLLLGGAVNLDGTVLFSEGGRVELGSLAGSGRVGLQTQPAGLSLQFPAEANRADVSLANRSILSASGGTGGSIAIHARNLDLSGGSVLLAGISSEQTAVAGRAGEILLNATENITLRQESIVANPVLDNARGDGGDIVIQARSLTVTDGSFLATFHQGEGKGGNILIDAADAVVFAGADNQGNPGTATTFASAGRGDVGAIRVRTGILQLKNGGFISTSTDRPGNAGNIVVEARDAIVLDGTAKDPRLVSGFFSAVGSGVVGNGGNIQLTTRSLSVLNGASLTTSTLGQGNAGNIVIDATDRVIFDGEGPRFFSPDLSGGAGNPNSSAYSTVGPGAVGNGGTIQITTGTLTVSNGAALSASTSGQGNAGDIRIQARETVTFDGVGRESGFSSGASSSVLLDAIGNGGTIQIETGSLFVTNGAVFLAITKSQGNSGNIRIDARDAVTVRGENPANPEFVSTIGAGAEETSTGQGGNLRITTPTLRLQDGGQLSAIHFGQGDAGAIEVQANTIQLENDAAIVTQSSSGNGGDITLTASDLLLMRQDSYIATSATATPERSNLGNGGNITLNTAFLVSAPLENNDIFATAISGRGGNITINAQGIYWFTPRSRTELEQVFGTRNLTQVDFNTLRTNDIITISRANPTLSGELLLNTPSLDPVQGLVELPGNLTDPSRLLANRCPARGKTRDSFYITGRGGIPERPGDLPISPYSTGTVRSLPSSPDTPAPPASPLTTEPASPIVEAQGWIKTPNGDIYLVAHTSREAEIMPPIDCPEAPTNP